jgi:hypothetical protein
MAKGPGVSATSHIIATSQTNVHYYIKKRFELQEKNRYIEKSNIEAPIFAMEAA